MKFIGMVIDPEVLNLMAFKVNLDDSIGTFIEPVFIPESTLKQETGVKPELNAKKSI